MYGRHLTWKFNRKTAISYWAIYRFPWLVHPDPSLPVTFATIRDVCSGKYCLPEQNHHIFNLGEFENDLSTPVRTLHLA